MFEGKAIELTEELIKKHRGVLKVLEELHNTLCVEDARAVAEAAGKTFTVYAQQNIVAMAEKRRR